jgi:alpha-beta hydrolase superfamily lysophospholipase
LVKKVREYSFRLSLSWASLVLLSPFLFSTRVAISREALSISRDLHWAVTGEKFELAMERLRPEKAAPNRAAVILSHGLFVNSLFLNLDEHYSLARYLASEGFDVWNLSLRGTGRSLNPLRGGPKSWTLDDIIDKDITSVIRYVQKESRKPKVIWIGYETGGLLLYGYLEKKGASGLSALVTIAAPVTFTHSDQEAMKRLLRLDESPTLKKIFLSVGPTLARLLVPFVPKLERLLYEPENMEDEIKEKLLDEALTEINPGVLDHLLMMIKRGEFVSANGDFSYRKNLAKIQLPLLLIGGEKDPVAPPEAIRAVHRAVGSVDRTVRIFGPRYKDAAAYGHMDLILGKKARQEVFPVIGGWLKRRDARE